MHAATASTTGWIETNAVHEPQCLFCGDPAGALSHSTKAGTPRSSGCGGAGRVRPHGSTDQDMDLVSFTLELSDGRPLEVDISGASGGDPYALACALLADRVLACATVAGVGPFGGQDLDFLAGMGRENHEEFGGTEPGQGHGVQSLVELVVPGAVEPDADGLAAGGGDGGGAN